MHSAVSLPIAVTIVSVTLLTSPTCVVAQEAVQQRGARPDAAEPGEPGEPSFNIGQGALAEWLTVQLSEAQSVSQFAGRRSQNEQIRKLARNTALAYTNLLRDIEGAAPQVATGGSVAGRSDISGELEEVAEKIREEAAQSPQQPDEARAVVRREARRPSREPARPESARQSTSETDAQAAEAESDEGSRRLLQREDGILARLRDAAAERSADRGTARERLQRILPALRANLPEVVDLVTDAIEEGAEPATLAWLELERQQTQRYAQSVQDELARYRGQALDRAYLGYELLTNLRLASALELVQQRAGPELRPVLDEGLQTLNNLSRQTRQLMTDAPGNGVHQP